MTPRADTPCGRCGGAWKDHNYSDSLFHDDSCNQCSTYGHLYECRCKGREGKKWLCECTGFVLKVDPVAVAKRSELTHRLVHALVEARDLALQLVEVAPETKHVLTFTRSAEHSARMERDRAHRAVLALAEDKE